MNQKGSPVIVHVSTQMGWRGGEQQLDYLFTELDRKGTMQTVVCRKGSAMEQRCITHRRPHVAWPRITAIDPLFALRLARLCRQLGASIVHAHDAHAHTMAVMAASFFDMDAGIIVSRRVDVPVKTGILSRWKYHHPSVRRIVCVSDAVRHVTASALAVPSKLVTVHSGIDMGRFEGLRRSAQLRSGLGAGSDDFLIGTVAALSPTKGLFTFLDTMGVLVQRHPGRVRAVIVGKGEMQAELEAYSKERGLAGTVLFAGFRNDIPEVLASLDLFLTTPVREGLGTSVLDAMAAGIPVVATAAGGIPEMVLDGETGLLAPVGDTFSLAERVEQLISDPGLRERLAAYARKHLVGFTAQRMAEGMMEVYRGMDRG